MLLSRLANAFVALAAAVLLSGCYVYALAPPVSDEGTINHSLEGSWYVLDTQGKSSGVLLHFVVPGDGAPMRMVYTDSAAYGVFELYSVTAGDTQVFAIRKLAGPVAGRAGIMAADNAKFLLGTYRIKGDSLLVYSFDTRRFSAAVASGAIRGKVASGYAPPVTLTGAPEDLVRALSTPEAQGAISQEAYPIARRVFPRGY